MAESNMTLEQFDRICENLETTHYGLLKLCRDEKFKSETSFRNLKRDNEILEKRYTHAREMQLDYLEDKLREVSFDESRDKEVIDKVNVGGNAVSRDRLKADTLKFILSKLRSTVYGNKVELTHKGEINIPNLPDIGNR